jgi:succinyl-diaminopimelate desuccinylase
MPHTLRNDLITLTTHLIRFRSTADQPGQLVAAIDYVGHYLSTAAGLSVHRSERNGKPAIVATLQQTRRPELLLNGHLDVVAAQPGQFEPQLRGNRIYGRGAQDMKGSVAVLMRLMKDLMKLEQRPNIGVQFVSDEEIGGADGTQRLLAEKDWRCDFFIAAEPTDMRICHQQKAALWVKLSIPGTPAHASRPWEGNNPIMALCTGLETLKQRFPILAREEWKTTITPTMARSAESSSNQIPTELSLMLDIRHIVEDTTESLLEAIHESFPTAQIVSQRSVRPLVTDAETPALKSLANITEEIRGEPTRVYREHFSSDARFYSEANIPAICFGPAGQGLHSAEEWVDIDSLVQFYDVLYAYIRREAWK